MTCHGTSWAASRHMSRAASKVRSVFSGLPAPTVPPSATCPSLQRSAAPGRAGLSKRIAERVLAVTIVLGARGFTLSNSRQQLAAQKLGLTHGSAPQVRQAVMASHRRCDQARCRAAYSGDLGYREACASSGFERHTILKREATNNRRITRVRVGRRIRFVVVEKYLAYAAVRISPDRAGVIQPSAFELKKLSQAAVRQAGSRAHGARPVTVAASSSATASGSSSTATNKTNQRITASSLQPINEEK